MLGRPVIVRLCDTDVPLPNLPSSQLALDGGTDVDLLYHSYMARLSRILAECMEEVCNSSFLSIRLPWCTLQSVLHIETNTSINLRKFRSQI